MEKISSTAPSTTELDRAVDALTPELAGLASSLFDELERRRATAKTTGQRAREVREDKTRAAVLQAAEDIAARRGVLSPELFAEEVHDRIDIKPGHYGLRQIPSDTLILKILTETEL